MTSFSGSVSDGVRQCPDNGSIRAANANSEARPKGATTAKTHSRFMIDTF